MGCLSSALLAQQVAYAVHVEGQGEAECLVEGVALCRGDDIASIEREDVHLEACTHGVVGAVALVGVLVVIAGTKEELVVVGIFQTDAPLDFLHLFLEAIWSIVERLEDAADGGNVVVAFAFEPCAVVTIVFS